MLYSYPIAQQGKKKIEGEQETVMAFWGIWKNADDRVPPGIVAQEDGSAGRGGERVSQSSEFFLRTEISV